MLKKILRKGFKIIYWSLFVLILILFFMGERSIWGNIAITGYVIYIICYIKNKMRYNWPF